MSQIEFSLILNELKKININLERIAKDLDK
jgi:hypothetical protein